MNSYDVIWLITIIYDKVRQSASYVIVNSMEVKLKWQLVLRIQIYLLHDSTLRNDYVEAVSVLENAFEIKRKTKRKMLNGKRLLLLLLVFSFSMKIGNPFFLLRTKNKYVCLFVSFSLNHFLKHKHTHNSCMREQVVVQICCHLILRSCLFTILSSGNSIIQMDLMNIFLFPHFDSFLVIKKEKHNTDKGWNMTQERGGYFSLF